MEVTPTGIQVGPVLVTFFGLIVIAGVAAGAAVSAVAVRRRSYDSEVLLDAITWGLVGGVIAGRLFYVWNPPPSVAAVYDRRWYFTHFFDLQFGPLALWSGGLGPAGILLGAAAAATLVLWRRGVVLRAWADLLAPGLLITLAIVPWANVVNQQLFGPPTSLLWGMTLTRRVPPYDDLTAFPLHTRFHPTPAYLSLWALIALGVVWLVEKRFSNRMRAGDRFLLAAAITLPGLFLADFLRFDVGGVLLGLTGMQVAVGLLFLGVVGGGVWRWRRLAGSEADEAHGPPVPGG